MQAGTGPDLVLIHGASGNVRDFTFRFIDRLKDRYRVTAFDRPGLGYTDPDPAYAGRFDVRAEGPAAQADLLHAAARKIGIRNEIVLGHSYGGAVAMAWGLGHTPSALVVVSGATQPWPGGLGPLYTITGSSIGGALTAPLITGFAPRSVVDAAVKSVFEPQDAPVGYADHVGTPLSLRRSAFRANARQVSSLRSHVVEMSRRYPSIGIPVEIVHGTADGIVPAHIHSEPLAEQIPGAILTKLDGIGHMPHHTSADAVLDAIDRAASRAGLR